MAKKTITKELEEEADKYFRNLLPNSWEIRDEGTCFIMLGRKPSRNLYQKKNRYVKKTLFSLHMRHDM